MLKGQDLLVLLALVDRSSDWTMRSLAADLDLDLAGVQRALKRLSKAGLYDLPTRRVNRLRAGELLNHGVQYFYPVEPSGESRGMPTAWAAEPLRSRVEGAELPPVWPDPFGESRGLAVEPLHPSVPGAAKKDPGLWAKLALVDALRIGDSRVRALAQDLLSERLAIPGPDGGKQLPPKEAPDAILRSGSPIGPSPWARTALERAILTGIAKADEIMREVDLRGEEGFFDRVVEWAGSAGESLQDADAGAFLEEFASEEMPSDDAREARWYLDKQRRRLRRALRTLRRDEHSALDLLKERYTSGRELQTRIVWWGGAETAERQAEADDAKQAVCEWAEETWEVLSADFPGHEREFYGPGDRALGEAFFRVSCQEEIENLGSIDTYLERKLEFLAELLRRYER